MAATHTILRVAGETHPKALAGAIAGCLRKGEVPVLDCIGVAAINQGVKAVIIARGYMASKGDNLCIAPSFRDIDIDGEASTGIRLTVCTKGDGG